MKTPFPKNDFRFIYLISRLKQAHILLLLVLAAMLFLLWGFIELADDVMEGDLQSMDEKLLLSLRNADDPADPVGPHWFEEMMRDATGLGGIGVLTFITIMSTGYSARSAALFPPVKKPRPAAAKLLKEFLARP